MNVFMIGGTGLLGSAAAAELIARGHQVKSIALPPCRKALRSRRRWKSFWGIT